MRSAVVVGMSNAIAAAAAGAVRRVLRVPFGEWRHPSGAVQRVNAGTAGRIYAALRRMLSEGAPGPVVYASHPDEGTGQIADPTEYGRVVDAAVEPAGIAFACDLTPQGIAQVRGGRNRFSPHWLARLAGGVAEPFELLSIGLTASPVIPVLPIANQQPPRMGQKGGPVRDKLLALLKTRGVELPDDADDDAIFAAVEAELGKTAAVANELAGRDAQILTLRGQTETAITAARQATEAMANERKAHAKTLLDGALSDGRVPPAARARWEAEFDADFGATVVKLGNAQPEVKTRARTGADAGRMPGNGGNVARICALVNEDRTKRGGTWDDAWRRVKAANGPLFGAA